MTRKVRILLSPGYHAEAGETKGHQHDVYTTAGELHGYQRIHVGTLMKSAVNAWANTSAAVNLHDEMVEALREAELQIVYLHEKFAETGSGNTTLARIRSVLSKSTPTQEGE